MVNEKHENILNKYSEIWDNIKELMEKDLDVKVPYNISQLK